ncbi:10542_t:CDS:2 [Ambispora gerdemannii]|uniref:10542_t:CDS:1 n=1 Tax=Ambispora gerdemannii TaxID=144530 RepID=A0A9N9G370_9GLOM|nr:10542_t:CDS:2 [Ambispora gerdemannii]
MPKYILDNKLDIEHLITARSFLKKALQEAQSELEIAGTIQAFEDSYELAYKTCRKILSLRGTHVYTAKECYAAIREKTLTNNSADTKYAYGSRVKVIIMTRTLSIAIKENTYQDLRQRVGIGKISSFVNQAVEKELKGLEKEKQKKKEQLRQQLILAHQRTAKNQKLKKELARRNLISEIQKTKETPKTFRPCLVISGDIQNEFNDLIAVVPITTENVKKIELFEVYLKNTPETGLDKPSKVQFIFPMTIDKELRLIGKQ